MEGVRKDGTAVPVELAWSVLNLGDKSLFTAIVRDHTDRKRVDNSLALQYSLGKIVTDSDTVDQMTAGVLGTVAERLNWAIGEFWMIDNDRKVLTLIDQWALPKLRESRFVSESKAVTFVRGTGLPGRIWESVQPCWIDDVTVDEGFVRRELAKDVGLHTAFGIPVTDGQDVIGVCQFFSEEVVAVDKPLLEAMAAVGQQLGHFIVNHRSEEALRQSETRFRAVFNQTSTLLGLLSLEGILLEANETAAKAAGLPAKELIGQPFG